MIEMCEDPTVAKEQKYMILRIAVWCVSNLCRGSGRAAPEWLQVIICLFAAGNLPCLTGEPNILSNLGMLTPITAHLYCNTR